MLKFSYKLNINKKQKHCSASDPNIYIKGNNAKTMC